VSLSTRASEEDFLHKLAGVAIGEGPCNTGVDTRPPILGKVPLLLLSLWPAG